ncbi:MAG: DUF488 domain-containing protein [Myxococcaceae bacterium]
MAIKTKRFNDPVEPDDGTRVLVTVYRPRGLKKTDETWDLWLKGLGPSPGLHADVYGKHGAPIPWSEYRSRYLAEIRDQQPLIESLGRRVAAGEAFTLLCSSACEDPARCHRTLLKALIEEEAERFR